MQTLSQAQSTEIEDSMTGRTECPPVTGEADGAQMIANAWEIYKANSCPVRREQLILHFAPLVSMVASRVAMRLPSTVEHADLVSYGMFGLIDAIEKFEPSREIKFETYASARIRGAIIDELRAFDWVPRSVRTKARAVDRARSELEAELHRAPNENELAGHLKMPLSELRAVYTQVSTSNIVALDELLSIGAERTDQISLLDTIQVGRSEDPASSFEAKETRYLLSRALEQLKDREKIVVVLYYYECMTLSEIGAVLGVSESRISQMHTAVMVQLRSILTRSEQG